MEGYADPSLEGRKGSGRVENEKVSVLRPGNRKGSLRKCHMMKKQTFRTLLQWPKVMARSIEEKRFIMMAI